MAINFYKKSGKSGLILFIHGFTGGDSTWSNQNGSSFPELMAEDAKIYEHFDIGSFEYFTQLTNTSENIARIRALVRNMFRRSHSRVQKNISIAEISETLATTIRFSLSGYDSIVLISHSMGGLVAKNLILNTPSELIPQKVQLYISLAVPHCGATVATFGKLINSNVQIGELAPLSQLISELNDRWLKSKYLPDSKFLYGVYDDVVSKTSSVPPNNDDLDSIALEEDHSSICKPESEDSETYSAVCSLIIDWLNSGGGKTAIEYQKLEGDNQYEDELFVLKLIVADIHQSTQRNAKELFLNAEYARKLFRSDHDEDQFSILYSRIKNLYQDSYDKFVHDGIDNPGQLLAEIHEKIVVEDKVFLSSFIPLIDAIHKKGMLHQLANNPDEEIWWSKDTGLEILEKYMNGLEIE